MKTLVWALSIGAGICGLLVLLGVTANTPQLIGASLVAVSVAVMLVAGKDK